MKPGKSIACLLARHARAAGARALLGLPLLASVSICAAAAAEKNVDLRLPPAATTPIESARDIQPLAYWGGTGIPKAGRLDAVVAAEFVAPWE